MYVYTFPYNGKDTVNRNIYFTYQELHEIKRGGGSLSSFSPHVSPSQETPSLAFYYHFRLWDKWICSKFNCSDIDCYLCRCTTLSFKGVSEEGRCLLFIPLSTPSLSLSLPLSLPFYKWNSRHLLSSIDLYKSRNDIAPVITQLGNSKLAMAAARLANVHWLKKEKEGKFVTVYST